MDEFAMGSSTENSAFHPTRNPWDLNRIPGGSSGGSAAAVAAGFAAASLGSDTGGSIRIPAALNGVVGFKNTARHVPTLGAVPLSTTMDTICANRICGNCGWLFIDRSKNRSRSWCDMAVCGNRVKANRHYHRKKKEVSP